MDSQDVVAFQNAVYAFANAVGGLAEIIGMEAENKYRENVGEAVAYIQKHFKTVVEDRGLHHNSLMKQIYGR